MTHSDYHVTVERGIGAVLGGVLVVLSALCFPLWVVGRIVQRWETKP